MAAVAIHLGEKGLALCKLVGVVLIILTFLGPHRHRRSAARRERDHRCGDGRLCAGGIGMDVADLAFATAEDQKRGRDYDESRGEPARAMHACTVPWSRSIPGNSSASGQKRINKRC